VSIRYEGADAVSLNCGITQGGMDVGEWRVPEGQFALEMWYDECFYVAGTKEQLLDMLARAKATVDQIPDTKGTRRVRKKVRDLKEGDLYKWPGADEEDWSVLPASPELVEPDDREDDPADYYTFDDQEAAGLDEVEVIEEFVRDIGTCQAIGTGPTFTGGVCRNKATHFHDGIDGVRRVICDTHWIED
jgi:hypothetical protein